MLIRHNAPPPVGNPNGLPEPLVRAVSRSTYDMPAGSLTITRLLQPPYKVHLEHLHRDEIEEQVEDRIWALMGSSMHHVLELAAGPLDVAERRIHMKLGPHEVSGRFDLLSENGTLSDWKQTSVYGMRELKPEHEAQLNLLRVLLEEGINVDPKWPKVERLQVIAIGRDWRAAESKRDPDYPQRVVVHDVPLWDLDRARAYLEERVRLHTMPNPPECTDAERWAAPAKVALMQKGKTRAIRLFDTVPEGLQLNSGQYLEERPAKYPRCESYCAVSRFCPVWKAHASAS
jgi:hypothetical protein